MARKSKRQALRHSIKLQPHILADGFQVPRPQNVYALPYYTRNKGDTEYLISNPNGNAVSGILAVFGKYCKLVKKLRIQLGPHCTRSIRLRAIAPEHAGHTILVMNAQVIAHILYMSGKGFAVEGGELAGTDNLFQWLPTERSRTYGFGYRSLPLGHDTLGGSVFVSNPNPAILSGLIVFFDQNCRVTQRNPIRIRPGCTQEFPFPKGRFGYGTIRVSHQAVINVLFFTASSEGLAAAELVGESNLIEVPADPPKPRRKILFDDTHQCRPGLVGDWTDYEKALNAAGYPVSHHTAPTVTLQALRMHDVFVIAMARQYYSQAEKNAITTFVSEGGGVMIVQDFGNAPWSAQTREILNLFGANDDNNLVRDPTPTHNDGDPTHPIFDYQRNFHAHPIVNGWKYFVVNALASLSGGSSWTTIVETDDDAIPSRRPVLLGRAFGQGRVLAFGDSNTWANHLLSWSENELFGIRCAEWLLFRI